MIRRMWTDDHITAEFPVHGARFDKIRAKPQPVGHVPIWIGGHAKPALERAVRVGDGWHGGFLPIEQTRATVAYLRERRPEPEFVISMRTRWDPLIDDRDTSSSSSTPTATAGVGHVVAEPAQRTLDDYLRSIEALAEIFDAGGVAMSPLTVTIPGRVGRSTSPTKVTSTPTADEGQRARLPGGISSTRHSARSDRQRPRRCATRRQRPGHGIHAPLAASHTCPRRGGIGRCAGSPPLTLQLG